MCQDSFDAVFDVFEELADCTGSMTVLVSAMSGRQYETELAPFVEDNLPVRSHLSSCLMLKQFDMVINMDLCNVESLALREQCGTVVL